MYTSKLASAMYLTITCAFFIQNVQLMSRRYDTATNRTKQTRLSLNYAASMASILNRRPHRQSHAGLGLRPRKRQATTPLIVRSYQLPLRTLFVYNSWSTWSGCHWYTCRQYRTRTCSWNGLRRGLCKGTPHRHERRCGKHHACTGSRHSNHAFPTPTSKPTPQTINNTGEPLPRPRRPLYPSHSCGLRQGSAMSHFRIVGGDASIPHTWPWHVALIDEETGRYFCGGTLVGLQWVLTAAHCVLNREMFGYNRHQARPMKVRVGDHSSRQQDLFEQTFRVETVYYHRSFDEHSIVFDFALLKLNRPVVLNRGVQMACVPDADSDVKIGTECVAIGWGDLGSWRGFPTKLQEVSLPVVSTRVCQSQFANQHNILPAIHLCAGRRGRDTCKGDSGGPLLCPRRTDGGVVRWFVHGVTSFGHKRGCGHSYGVYQRVAHVSAWLKRVIRRH